MVFQVIVIGCSKERMVIDLCDTKEELQTVTVLQLKKKIRERCSGWNADDIRLMFASQTLNKDSDFLVRYGIQHKSVLQMVLILEGGGEYDPEKEDGGKGDKDKSGSMERLAGF